MAGESIVDSISSTSKAELAKLADEAEEEREQADVDEEDAFRKDPDIEIDEYDEFMDVIGQNEDEFLLPVQKK